MVFTTSTELKDLSTPSTTAQLSHVKEERGWGSGPADFSLCIHAENQRPSTETSRLRNTPHLRWPVGHSEAHIWCALRNAGRWLASLPARPRPRGVDYLSLFRRSAPVVLRPSTDRGDATRPPLAPFHLTIWPTQPPFFLISLCPLLFKNSAEKEKTIFQNILAVISRKYSGTLRLSSSVSAGGRNMAGWSFCLLAAHDRPINWILRYRDVPLCKCRSASPL